ncbi:MAG: dephospho-CoA kinase [Desulfamplus sp.]|nr:dephospho-CoA kinase [Desulfamplus sp.]
MNNITNASEDVPTNVKDVQTDSSHDLINICEIKSRIRLHGNPLHVGLTGGIASGKSTVTDMFRENGAAIIDFDILARKVVEPNTKGFADIVNCFGSIILDKSGGLNRKALSRIIFQDSNKRKELERLLHPAIFESFCEEVKRIVEHNRIRRNCYRNEMPEQEQEQEQIVEQEQEYEKKWEEKQNIIIVSVIPLLIEMNLQKLFDKLIVVHLSSDIQLKRLMKRDCIDINQASNMVKSQMPIDDKIRHADFLVDNSGDLQNTCKQVDKIWNVLTKLSHGLNPTTPNNKNWNAFSR